MCVYVRVSVITYWAEKKFPLELTDNADVGSADRT